MRNLEFRFSHVNVAKTVINYFRALDKRQSLPQGEAFSGAGSSLCANARDGVRVRPPTSATSVTCT
jgi:hypothetical protein